MSRFKDGKPQFRNSGVKGLILLCKIIDFRHPSGIVCVLLFVCFFCVFFCFFFFFFFFFFLCVFFFFFFFFFFFSCF